MEALIWVATGALAGWIAGKLMKGQSYGWAGSIILGLMGSLVGGWLMQLLGGGSGGAWWQRAVVAALGATVVLGIARRLYPVGQPAAPLAELSASLDLEAQIARLSHFERRIVERMLGRQKPRDPNAAFDEQMTFGQRMADQVAAFGGSWTFIGVFLLAWMIVNSQARRPIDAFPFILLNLMLSCLAALQAPVIMMSQNRQAAKDRNDAKVDYEVNLRAETNIARVLETIELRDAEIRELIEINRRQLALLERLGPASS
jgi:uncharacterized membrane protein/uncharacterized membrane protein YeaQ/YmgE (transglycosylase-associated protein family)